MLLNKPWIKYTLIGALALLAGIGIGYTMAPRKAEEKKQISPEEAIDAMPRQELIEHLKKMNVVSDEKALEGKSDDELKTMLKSILKK